MQHKPRVEFFFSWMKTQLILVTHQKQLKITTTQVACRDSRRVPPHSQALYIHSKEPLTILPQRIHDTEPVLIPGKGNSAYSWYLNRLCSVFHTSTCPIGSSRLLHYCMQGLFFYLHRTPFFYSDSTTRMSSRYRSLSEFKYSVHIPYPISLLDLIHLLISYLC